MKLIYFYTQFLIKYLSRRLGGRMELHMSEVSNSIKKLRQEKKLSQEELAEKLYVTRQAVSNWENGISQT